MEAYQTGYDDERFQHPVAPSFHCCICTNVFRDPVMCRRNEHIFCRACITKYLEQSQKCPTCAEPLTVHTLRQATRTIANLVSELKIRCEFFERGCGKFIELGSLDGHLRECEFAPVPCSNKGCKVEMNKQHIQHHETKTCEFRNDKCHNCCSIQQEMHSAKVSLTAIKMRLDGNEKKWHENEGKLRRLEEITKVSMKEMVSKFKLVEKQLKKQEESNRQLEANNVDMKKSLDEITKHLEKISQQTLKELRAEKIKKGNAEADVVDKEPKVVVVGSYDGKERLNSVEKFNLSNKTWTRLPSMNEGREGASLVVHNNQLIVMGGYTEGGVTKTMETISLNNIQTEKAAPWKRFPVGLPGRLVGHCSVVYYGKLIVIGGYDADKHACSDSITKVSLTPPYTSKLLATMPQRRCRHSIALFGDKILIVGGSEGRTYTTNLNSVLLYDITKNELTTLRPLRCPVSDMATVKWGGDNIMVMGGTSIDGEALNEVLVYNVKTQTTYVLPKMTQKRRGCVAITASNTVIVMGGHDGSNRLKTVESFRFDRFIWERFPDMHDVRFNAAAVAW